MIILSTIIFIALAGSIGAICRYYLDYSAKKYFKIPAPIPIFGINVLASFLMGLITIVLTSHITISNIITNGFCGGFSTFSTYSVDIFNLLHARKYFKASSYMLTSITAASLAYYWGMEISYNFLDRK